MGATLLFGIFAFLIVACSLMVVLAKDSVVSAVFLVADLFVMACIYALLGADFVAAIQVLVYAGAILILFLFVIMLLNLDIVAARTNAGPLEIGMFIVVLIGFGILVVNLLLGERIELLPPGDSGLSITGKGNSYDLGLVLFSKYLWPFEMASVLILLAMVAGVLIAKRGKKKQP